MTITNFTVDFVNHPDGKYKASLKGKDQNGHDLKLSMGKHSLAPFQKGGSYLIDYERKSFMTDEGEKSYYAFNGMVDGGAEAYPGAAPANGSPVDDLEAQAKAMMERVAAARQAEQQKAQAIGKVHHAEELKAAQIFVTGVVGRAAGNGLPASELKMFGLAAVDAWRAISAALDGKIQQSTLDAGGAPVGPIGSGEPGLDDDIPF